jgi:hypothetical protein
MVAFLSIQIELDFHGAKVVLKQAARNTIHMVKIGDLSSAK